MLLLCDAVQMTNMQHIHINTESMSECCTHVTLQLNYATMDDYSKSIKLLHAQFHIHEINWKIRYFYLIYCCI